MKTVVCDAGPVIHLHEADALLLLSNGGDVFVPPTVREEALPFLPVWPSWLHPRALSEDASRRAVLRCRLLGVHRGEAEAMGLAEEINADWLLTDDAAARLLAAGAGIEVHGSLGVVLWNAARGLTTQIDARARLHALSQSSLWVSDAILREAEGALREIFATP